MQLLVSDNDVNSYKQIKDDLDGLRLLVEKSELWVYKPKSVEEKGLSNKTKNSISGKPGTNGGSNNNNNNSKFIVNGSIKEEDEGNDDRQPSPDAEEEVVVAKLSTVMVEEHRKGSLFDQQNVGPPLDQTQLRNYKTIEQILIRMNRLCVHSSNGKERPHEQLLLRNMGVHTVILDLLQIPFESKEDVLMIEIMKLAHEFLQNFCLNNQANQAILHKNIELFLSPSKIQTLD